MPPELRKRLAEIGWVQAEMAVDEPVEWILTPMSLLHIYQKKQVLTWGHPILPRSLREI